MVVLKQYTIAVAVLDAEVAEASLLTKSLSENTSRAKYGPCEGEVQEGEVVGGLLFPADE